MSNSRAIPLLCAAALLTGCPTGLTIGDDDDSALAPFEECTFTWGVPTDAQAVIVDPLAGPGGDGSAQAPANSLQVGLDLARAGDISYVVLTEGEFGGAPFVLGAADEGLQISGCGSGSVIKASGTLGFDVADGVSGVTLRGLVVEDARVGVRIRDGAGADTPIRLFQVDIVDSVRLGVEVIDAGTRADLATVNVTNVSVDPAGDALGYGILGWGADLVRLTTVDIGGATRAGVCLSATTFEVLGLSVSSTEPFDGELGRGIQIQDGATGTLGFAAAALNSDAGLFLFQTGAVSVSESAFTATSAATVPDAPDGTISGAGIVASTGILVEPGDPPDPMVLVFDTNTVSDNARLGLLFEGFGIQASLDTTTLSNNFLPDEGTFPIEDAPFFQLGAEVDVVAGDPAVELLDDAIQTIYRVPLPVGDD